MPNQPQCGESGSMTEPSNYEIVIRGRASARILRPLLDDFEIEWPDEGVTKLVGVIRDPAHLHGILVHLTSMNTELISVAPRDIQEEHHTKEDQK